ncbi:MAG: PaaI family thioesterase [Anaerolineales bacterium]
MSKQPNSRMCFVCGVSNPVGLGLAFYEDEPGRVVADWTPPEKYQGYPGLVHGGIVASALDEIAGRTLMGGESPRFMVTVSLSVKYRHPVPVGKPLRLCGQVTRDHGRLARAHAQLMLPSGEVAAEADVHLAQSPQGPIGAENFDRLGWKVYPDEPARI